MLEDERKHREKCLQMSIEINCKIGNLQKGMKPEEINDAIKNVFTLSDIFMHYVMNATNPYNEDE